jgi:plasmid maintenance system antidote protein VapI
MTEPDAVKSSADSPPGDDYGREQAAQVLGISPRRVSQLVADGRLLVVQEKPLRVSAQSVHELREERRGRNRDQRATLPPESVAEQVERLVTLVTNEQRRALEVGEHLLAEVTQQRDELKAEAERLRAQVEAERERAENLRTQLEAAPVRRKWWGR